MVKNLILKCLFTSLLSGACIYLTEKAICEENSMGSPVEKVATATSMPMPTLQKKMVMIHISLDDEKINNIEVELTPIGNNMLSHLCKANNDNNNDNNNANNNANNTTPPTKTLKDFTLMVSKNNQVVIVDSLALDKFKSLQGSMGNMGSMDNMPKDKMFLPMAIGEVKSEMDKTRVESASKITIDECVEKEN